MTSEVIDYYEHQLEESRAAAPVWTIGDRIRKIRRLQHMKQDEFARQVEVAPGTLRSWESGATEPKRSDLLIFSMRCQLAFGIPAWWTLGNDGPANILEDPDPRARATAMRILEEELRGERVRRQGLEPRTRCLGDSPSHGDLHEACTVTYLDQYRAGHTVAARLLAVI